LRHSLSRILRACAAALLRDFACVLVKATITVETIVMCIDIGDGRMRR
jgi:hypothetical protein